MNSTGIFLYLWMLFVPADDMTAVKENPSDVIPAESKIVQLFSGVDDILGLISDSVDLNSLDLGSDELNLIKDVMKDAKKFYDGKRHFIYCYDSEISLMNRGNQSGYFLLPVKKSEKKFLKMLSSWEIEYFESDGYYYFTEDDYYGNSMCFDFIEAESGQYILFTVTPQEMESYTSGEMLSETEGESELKAFIDENYAHPTSVYYSGVIFEELADSLMQMKSLYLGNGQTPMDQAVHDFAGGMVKLMTNIDSVCMSVSVSNEFLVIENFVNTRDIEIYRYLFEAEESTSVDFFPENPDYYFDMQMNFGIFNDLLSGLSGFEETAEIFSLLNGNFSIAAYSLNHLSQVVFSEEISQLSSEVLVSIGGELQAEDLIRLLPDLQDDVSQIEIAGRLGYELDNEGLNFYLINGENELLFSVGRERLSSYLLNQADGKAVFSESIPDFVPEEAVSFNSMNLSWLQPLIDALLLKFEVQDQVNIDLVLEEGVGYTVLLEEENQIYSYTVFQ